MPNQSAIPLRPLGGRQSSKPMYASNLVEKPAAGSLSFVACCEGYRKFEPVAQRAIVGAIVIAVKRAGRKEQLGVNEFAIELFQVFRRHRGDWAGVLAELATYCLAPVTAADVAE